MAGRGLANAYYNFTANDSRKQGLGLPTIYSADDASLAQSEVYSVAISDASSVKSSEYAASRMSDTSSVKSSECSESIDDFSHLDDDTTLIDDNTTVSDLPSSRPYASKSASLSVDSTESTDSPWVDDCDASSSDSDTCYTDIEVAARSSKHPRSKRPEMTKVTRAGKEWKPIDLTDLETGSQFPRVTTKVDQTHTLDRAKLDRVDGDSKFKRVNATMVQTQTRAHGQAKLRGVDYVSSLDMASTNMGLSVVEPIGKRQASDAFQRVIPTTIPVDSDRDDLSSIGALSKLSRFSVRNSDNWRRAGEDARPQRHNQAAYVQEREVSTKEPWFLGRSDLEVFFITLISVSLFILIVLLIIILTK